MRSEFISQVDADVRFSAVSPMEKNRFTLGDRLEVWHFCGTIICMMVSIDSGSDTIYSCSSYFLWRQDVINSGSVHAC